MTKDTSRNGESCLEFDCAACPSLARKATPTMLRQAVLKHPLLTRGLINVSQAVGGMLVVSPEVAVIFFIFCPVYIQYIRPLTDNSAGRQGSRQDSYL